MAMDNMPQCPMLLAANRMFAECVEERCAWWCESAGCCAVSLISEILSSIEGDRREQKD